MQIYAGAAEGTAKKTRIRREAMKRIDCKAMDYMNKALFSSYFYFYFRSPHHSA